MSLNLPPGVSDYDIPGNRTEDIEWENLIDKMMSDIDSPYEARQVWEQGLKSHNTQMHMDGLCQCPYDKATRCRMDEPCRGCETWAAHQ